MKQWGKIYKHEGKGYEYYDILKPHEDMLKILKLLKKRVAEKVLDLGCGAGRNTVFLAKHGFKVFGIDIAEEGIKIAKRQLKKDGLKAELKIGSMYKKLPYRDNFFDAIISVQTLQHGRAAQIKKAIAEMKRVIRPGGLVFVTVCGRHSRGEVRHCLVKTAKKIAPRTYVPTIGNEAGLVHFIFNKTILRKYFRGFKMLSIWKDDLDYYCLLAEKK